MQKNNKTKDRVMHIQVAAISEIGKRANNEDHLLVNEVDGLFVVCDGVGGHEKGEIASSLSCSTVGQFFKGCSAQPGTKTDIIQAISMIETAFDRYIQDHPLSSGMASTLVLVHIFADKGIIAHVGDSRAYHVRNGKILLKTFDHSLVNELVATGNLTLDEAVNHPDRNKLTRALQGRRYPAIPDVNEIILADGDLILLCTDGVLESINDDDIVRMLVPGTSPQNILDQIGYFCRLGSSDNYSAIILRVVLNDQL